MILKISRFAGRHSLMTLIILKRIWQAVDHIHCCTKQACARHDHQRAEHRADDSADETCSSQTVRAVLTDLVAKYDGDDAASQADHAADNAEKITYDRNDAEHQ